MVELVLAFSGGMAAKSNRSKLVVAAQVSLSPTKRQFCSCVLRSSRQWMLYVEAFGKVDGFNRA